MIEFAVCVTVLFVFFVVLFIVSLLTGITKEQWREARGSLFFVSAVIIASAILAFGYRRMSSQTVQIDDPRTIEGVLEKTELLPNSHGSVVVCLHFQNDRKFIANVDLPCDLTLRQNVKYRVELTRHGWIKSIEPIP